jgi:glycosyltransferase involved in cell wall biosynthesis
MSMERNLIVKRIKHHAGHSGYDRLADYVPGRVIAAELRGPADRVLARSLRVLERRSGLRWYHRAELVAEARAVARAVRPGRRLFHFLYGENCYRYLGEVRRALPWNRVVATYHTPRERFTAVVSARRHLARLDACVVVSTVQRAFLEAWIAPERIHYVPHGVDVDYYRPAADPVQDGPFRCLTVGAHLRDFDTLEGVVAAFGDDPEVRFDLVVPEPVARRFAGYRRVRTHTGIPEPALRELYRRAHVLLLPLEDGTANNAVLEAMACGTPLVTTEIPGTLDYVDRACAWLTPRAEVEALVEALRALRDDEARRRAMGRAARERALTFSWESVARRMEALYADVCGA